MVPSRHLTSSEGKSTLQHTLTCYTILCFQLCGILGKGLYSFSITIPLRTKRGPYTKWFVKIGVEELDRPTQSPDLNHLKDELER
jgi:hypothetical protein